jgi:ABC-type dipeptide/oligopeptide/nickel transport system ATPase component
MVFITHDLPVALRVSDRLAVMYGGKFIEEGPTETVGVKPTHAYTRQLLQSIPTLRGPKPRVWRGAGNMPMRLQQAGLLHQRSEE